MAFKLSSFLLAFLTVAGQTWATQNSTIQWGPCPTNGTDADIYAKATVPIECAKFDVPLDYTQSDSSMLTLNLLKVPAPQQPPKGTIQMNFGGPGSPAKKSLIRQADVYQAMGGGVYDFVVFEPRGVGEEIKFICTDQDDAKLSYFNSVSDMAFNEYESRRGWALGQATAGTCQYQGNGNKTGEYIGTVAMAKDMARIAEAVDEDGLIRYWGFSYGTTLGATISALFPDRVDRMILDGVQNPHQYYRDWIDSELWSDTDKVVDYIFIACANAGPEICPLAKVNRTGEEMVKDFRQFVQNITDAPIAVPKLGLVFDGFQMKTQTFSVTYDTQGWGNYSAVLAGLIYGTPDEREDVLTAWLGAGGESAGAAILGAPRGSSTGEVDFGILEPNMAIHCADRIPRTNYYDIVEPSLKKLYSTSYYQGGANAIVTAICANWPWKAKETYEGNFEVNTKHPVLFMTNLYDGQTPMVSAQNVSSTFEGSIILANNGAGHAAFSAPSACTAKYIIDYFVNGNLPPVDTVCEPTDGPYETRPWTATLAEMAAENKTA